MKYLLLFILLILFSSCGRIMLNLLTDKSAIDKVRILQNEDKEIVYIPMVHLGSDRYFEEIRFFVDSLRKENYAVYYEGLKYKDSTHFHSDTLPLKFRKLLGLHLTNFNNIDNNSLPRAIRNSKFTMQTLENTGIDHNSDFLVDPSVEELIEKFEKEHGEIKLTECDLQTNLMEKYNCKDEQFMPQYRSFNIVAHDYRDENLIDALIKSPHNKIVLLYGKDHWIKAIFPMLVHKNDYELVYGKI